MQDSSQEVDLRELFKLINKRKFLIIIITIFLTVTFVVVGKKTKDVYIAKAYLKIGYLNVEIGNHIEDPFTVLTEIKLTSSNSINLEKSRLLDNKQIIQIVASSDKNVTDTLDKIVEDIITRHSKKLNSFKHSIIQNIEQLQLVKKQLVKKNATVENSLMSLDFGITSKINDLNSSISSFMIVPTSKIGKTTVHKQDTNHKNTVIFFILSFIISILLSLILEFFKKYKRT